MLDEYGHEARLPPLPIPNVQETVATYLRTLRPLLDDQAFAQSSRAAAQFLAADGAGATLQARLQQYASSVARRDEEHGSWLSAIWLAKGYMEYREPCAPLVSMTLMPCVCQHRRPVAPPPAALQLSAQSGPDRQLFVAARIMAAAVEYREALESCRLPPEQVAGKPVCMEQNRWVFGVTRIPEPVADRASRSPPALSRAHCVVGAAGFFFRVPLYHGGDKSDGSGPLSVVELLRQLRHVNRLASELSTQAAAGQTSARDSRGVGVFTAARRDDWARVRPQLVAAAPCNGLSLRCIETAAFCVSLDASRPESINALLWEGACGPAGAGHRWFDKTSSWVVFANGKYVTNAEHSPADALGHRALVDHVAQRLAEPLRPGADGGGHVPPAPEPLQFLLSVALRGEMAVAAACLQREARRLDVHAEILVDWGTDYMKKTLRTSPDALVQLAAQLAYFRLHGRLCPTYETVEMRHYRFGRTETGRSVTDESAAFVQAAAAAGERRAPAELAALFKRAVGAHIAYRKMARAGRGVDRHLLGLRAMVRPDEPQPSLFADPAYAFSGTFALSTSNTSMLENWCGTFAPVTEHGYGLCYSVHSDTAALLVSSNHTSQRTKTARQFGEAVSCALSDIASWLLAASSSGTSGGAVATRARPLNKLSKL